MRTGSVRSLTENGGMTQTTHRVLRLLGLLETRTTWRGDELAERLGVTGRTVRRDVARLRDLGYPVEAEPGMAGGYRLGGGRRLPPLVLEDDEAVALVACLRMAALTGGDAVGEAALRALTKLDQVLPARLRAVAAAIDGATRAMPRVRPAVDLRVLEQLAVAQRDHNLVRFYYCKPRGGGRNPRGRTRAADHPGRALVPPSLRSRKGGLASLSPGPHARSQAVHLAFRAARGS